MRTTLRACLIYSACSQTRAGFLSFISWSDGQRRGESWVKVTHCLAACCATVKKRGKAALLLCESCQQQHPGLIRGLCVSAIHDHRKKGGGRRLHLELLLCFSSTAAHILPERRPTADPFSRRLALDAFNATAAAAAGSSDCTAAATGATSAPLVQEQLSFCWSSYSLSHIR